MCYAYGDILVSLDKYTRTPSVVAALAICAHHWVPTEWQNIIQSCPPSPKCWSSQSVTIAGLVAVNLRWCQPQRFESKPKSPPRSAQKKLPIKGQFSHNVTPLRFCISRTALSSFYPMKYSLPQHIRLLDSIYLLAFSKAAQIHSKLKHRRFCSQTSCLNCEGCCGHGVHLGKRNGRKTSVTKGGSCV